jgi:hypothetical protein
MFVRTLDRIGTNNEEDVMRKADLLFFADRIQFKDVDLYGPDLPKQFCMRITEFYIRPAEECAGKSYAFAAGVLLVSCIDALARIRYGRLKGTRFRPAPQGTRFKQFVREELPSFSTDQLAEKFYEDFRCGLVHEALLKNGGQFSCGTEATLDDGEGLLVINPMSLTKEVSSSLRKYLDLLERDPNERAKLATALKQDFARDFSFSTLADLSPSI